MTDAPRTHILTVNLEDYYQVSPLRDIIPRGHWPRFEQRVERNTLATLDLLDRHQVKATFFASGWIAKAQPDVIAEVVRRGHDLGSKGYHHRSLQEMSAAEFRDDVRRARDALEDASGIRITGYRIAKGRFTLDHLWALDILTEEGFLYDSSLRLLGRDAAGQRHRRVVHRHGAGERGIWEIPISTWSIAGFNLPFAGGNFMRQLPDPLIRGMFARWNARIKDPLVLYFHVWELDPELPRVAAAPMIERVRQYRNLDKMPGRVETYLSRYRFTSISDFLALEKPVASTRPQAGPAVVAATVSGPKTKATIVVPCYNEEIALPYLANTIAAAAGKFAADYDLSYVFVDDGSTDKTWESLHRLFAGRADCTIVRHPFNRGVAAATMTGITAATTEIVCAIDCDCTYDPLQLLDMIPLLASDVDLVTASPYHPEGRVVNVPAWRLALSRQLSRLYRLMLTQRLATVTSCFRVYRRSAVTVIAIRHGGFLGVAEILARMDQSGSKIVEYPAVLEVRILGRSKMKIFRTIIGHLKMYASLMSEQMLQRMRLNRNVPKVAKGH